MMLDLKLFRKGELVYEGSALNEAVVRASVSVVKLEAFSDGREVTAFSGDGMIASTPTGSTAYSMAAAGRSSSRAPTASFSHRSAHSALRRARMY